MVSNMTARALVANGPLQNKGSWNIQDIKLRELKENELLVKLAGTGICHTDIIFGSFELTPENPLAVYPRILGHEGTLRLIQKAGQGLLTLSLQALAMSKASEPK